MIQKKCDNELMLTYTMHQRLARRRHLEAETGLLGFRTDSETLGNLRHQVLINTTVRLA